MIDPIAYLRDLDGTGSLHVCAKGDPGAIPVAPIAPIEASGRDRETGLDPEGTKAGNSSKPLNHPRPPMTEPDLIERVLAFLKANGETHTRWAEYFETNPKIEAEYLATGVWDDAKEHRRLEAGYAEAATLLQSQQQIIGELRAVLSRLAGDPTTHNNDPYDYRNIARAALNKQESLG